MTTEPAYPIEGGCRCGKVRFRVSAPPVLSAACHCTGCRRMTASAFSLSIAVPEEGFAILSGETAVGGAKGPDVQHYLCADCGSWVFSRAAMLGPLVNLRTTMLDDPSPFPPFIEMWTAEKLSFASVDAKHGFPGFPPMEEFGNLAREYAAARGGGGARQD